MSPYARLARVDRPVGTYLLMWPGYWSLALATTSKLPDPILLGKFGVGAFIMRSAGCTINDILDRKFDAKVERTKTRPLASGEITLPKAIAFLGAQLTAGLFILLTLEPYAIYWGAVSVVPVCLYPLAKRVFDWPQLVLGFTFNWGAILGWAAARGSIDWDIVLPLYLGSAAWTLGYDTIYAHQDKHDDKLLGLHSSALTVGDEATKIFLTCTYAFSLACLTGAGLKYANTYGGMDPRIFQLGMTGVGLNLAYQVHTLKVDDSKDLGLKFKMNHWAGPSMFAGIVIGKILA
jgi:4-hydroxybenzoate polyprenyl transferase